MSNTRPTDSLRFHESVAEAWSLDDLDSRFGELVSDIQANGILEPIWITEAGQIVDGRHRWRAAKQLGLPEVPVQVLPRGIDPAMFAISVLCARRHLATKGQIAYAAYHLFEARHRELSEAKARGLRRGSEEAAEETLETTVGEIAQKLGISLDLFKQAARLHRMFRERPELRQAWEPKIMAEFTPCGLGAAIAGIAGQAATAGVTPERNSHYHRFSTAWDKLARPTAAWSRLSDEERRDGEERITRAVEALPLPVLDVLTNALRSARRKREEAAG